MKIIGPWKYGGIQENLDPHISIFNFSPCWKIGHPTNKSFAKKQANFSRTISKKT